MTLPKAFMTGGDSACKPFYFTLLQKGAGVTSLSQPKLRFEEIEGARGFASLTQTTLANPKLHLQDQQGRSSFQQNDMKRLSMENGNFHERQRQRL